MKAILLSEYGGPEKLELRDRPEPEPGAGQIKVRVASASLNPVDWKLRSGALKKAMPLELPTILGRDAAGEVVKVGSGVTSFKVGDRVLGLVNGGYADFVVAPAEAWAKLPEALRTEDAGAYPLVLLTGDQLIDAALGTAPAAGQGVTVLVTGAAGAVGRAAVWVAKQRGCTVLAGVRSKQLDDAKKLGADGIVALDDDAALGQLAAVDRIADTVGGQTIAKLLPKLKPGGIVGSALGEPQGAKALGIRVNAFHTHPDAARLSELAMAVASGKLVIPIGKRFALAEAAAAHAVAERGGVGKVLLNP
jgi:NADPH:quinone reductase-like Zn-dependent oxidoreductase